jgi:hypothetical protein
MCNLVKNMTIWINAVCIPLPQLSCAVKYTSWFTTVMYIYNIKRWYVFQSWCLDQQVTTFVLTYWHNLRCFMYCTRSSSWIRVDTFLSHLHVQLIMGKNWGLVNGAWVISAWRSTESSGGLWSGWTAPN